MLLEEYRRHLIKALFELDYVLEDMEFDNNKGNDYNTLKVVKHNIMYLDKQLLKEYNNECEKWVV